MTDQKLMISAIQAGGTSVVALVAIRAEKEAPIGKVEQASG
jgi:hypothetical protein